MRNGAALRLLTALVAVSVLFGTTSVLAGDASSPSRKAADQRGPSLQHLSGGGDHDWSNKPVDENRRKPAGTFAAPTSDHAPDVPGQPVVARPERAAAVVTPAPTSRAQIAKIRAVVAARGEVRVNVTTTLPRGLAATASSAAAHRSEVAQLLDALRDRVLDSGAREVSRLSLYPWASYSVNAAGLEALLADPSVISVMLDAHVSAALAESTGIIRSTQLNQAGTLGNGWTGSPVGASEVVIIDSGVDNDHSAFTGRVVAEACFSAGSDCPGGGSVESGPDTGENCTYAARCKHGTHTASIAAGGVFSNGHEGVARGAGIVSIQVGSLSATGWTAMLSDINLALQYAYDRKNGGANVTAVNLSLHIPDYVTDSACDAANGDFAASQALAANLQGLGVAVVAAAGNDNADGVSYPACLSSVYAVSATRDGANPAAFTNSGSLTDWWAPGVDITAAYPGTAARAKRSGTSTAAPHLTGAFALLRQCVDGNGVQLTNSAAVARLNATGRNVTDHGATRKRIDVLDAATGTVNNNDFANPEVLPVSGVFNDFDFNICSDAEPGEPGPFSLDNGVWWSWTPAATGTATVSTDDGGGNVTTFDTTLSIYTGSTLVSLKVVAFDDDSGVGLRSLATFPVNGGTTYRIKVDGFSAATGLLNLHIENNPPPTCQGVAATLVGYGVNDVINGTPGPDVIVAGAGNDTINGRGGSDRICADAGEDTVNAGAGNDLVFGGPGIDNISGTKGNDTLLGNAGGGDTDDVGDVIQGGPGEDTLDGWVGDDRLVGGPGGDLLLGAAGIDTADYSTTSTAVTANLAAGTATGAGNDTLNQIEDLIGSAFNDVLQGDGVTNSISGLAGRDTIRGGAAGDSLSGGDGHDTVRGGDGNDTVRGNEGNDALRGEQGTDNCIGGPGADTAASCETVSGVP